MYWLPQNRVDSPMNLEKPAQILRGDKKDSEGCFFLCYQFCKVRTIYFRWIFIIENNPGKDTRVPVNIRLLRRGCWWWTGLLHGHHFKLHDKVLLYVGSEICGHQIARIVSTNVTSFYRYVHATSTTILKSLNQKFCQNEYGITSISRQVGHVGKYWRVKPCWKLLQNSQKLSYASPK